MSTNQNRVPAGVPTGGRFAAATHSEPGVSLQPRRHLLSTDQAVHVANSRADRGVPVIDLTAQQVSEVQQWVDVTGDFSYRTVRAQAEEIYVRDNRYTPAEYQAYLAAGGTTASAGDTDGIRRDIEQRRKDSLEGSAITT